jgi:hypothetical protein
VAMSRTWIQSWQGKGVTPLHLKPEQVVFEDIPHALAQKTRFNGHLNEFYSVAQHCCLGAEQIGGPARSGDYDREQLLLKLAFLLHELSEVYLPDVPAPIKPHLFVKVNNDGNEISWAALENLHAETMLKALGLEHIFSFLDHDAVHKMDRAMLVTEKRDLRGPDIEPEVIAQENARYSGDPLQMRILRCWSPKEAEHEFTVLYHWLRKELAK